jgi:hypothetical protein
MFTRRLLAVYRRGRTSLNRPRTAEEEGESMKTRYRRLVVAISVAAVLAASVATPVSAAEDANGTPIIYSETYLRYVALFPQRWAPNACVLEVAVKGIVGFCEDAFNPVYFYPDGSVGARPWVVDAESPSGWSVPNPCVGLTEDQSALWALYVDWVNGYFDTGPSLTADQVERYGDCWGWWF